MTHARACLTLVALISLGTAQPVDTASDPVEIEIIASPLFDGSLLRGDAPNAPPAERIDVSMSPMVTVRHGTSAQHQRLDLALDRFRNAGLALPDLEVVFATTDALCQGHLGLFERGFAPWKITICSELGFVFEHELAHAWEAATLTDELREGFMELRGYTVWSRPGVPWNERGVEGVAFIIQQGLSGLPLTSVISDEQLSRLDGFELLTGFTDPRLSGS